MPDCRGASPSSLRGAGSYSACDPESRRNSIRARRFHHGGTGALRSGRPGLHFLRKMSITAEARASPSLSIGRLPRRGMLIDPLAPVAFRLAIGGRIENSAIPTRLLLQPHIVCIRIYVTQLAKLTGAVVLHSMVPSGLLRDQRHERNTILPLASSVSWMPPSSHIGKFVSAKTLWCRRAGMTADGASRQYFGHS